MLGSGGTGSVWLARDETNGLDVALKIVPREGKAASRAEREAEAAARLRHPRCVRAYDFASDERNVYIAYEYVAGRTLREAIRAGEVDDAVAVETASQILEGLAHAHGQGIVHRDVKPSNVLLADGDGISVRLLDFGLARIKEAETLTAAGDVPGTLAYISPERLKGAAGSPAADVWGVGVVLWETLAGYHPFWTSSLVETAKAIDEGAPPLHSVRPDLPKALHAFVDRALAVNPARRPSARELAEALRHAHTRRKPAGSGPARREAARVRLKVPAVAPRLGASGLAAVTAAAGATLLPFYPANFAAGLAALAAALGFARPRIGMIAALAVPIFPLGNASLGLALLYAALASVWVVLMWREPLGGLLFALGPLLAPIGALGLMPLVVQGMRTPWRRALQTAVAVLAAAVVAGLRKAPLPFTGATPPLGLGIAGSNRPVLVAGELWRALQANQAIGIEALALAAIALAIPYARAHGRWGAAVLGAAMLSLTLLCVPTAAALPLVLAAWVTCAALALPRAS
ncbi:MAG TPA: serine/threonine-protein kinase [Gaiellaceae bacterium]|nr:serine/threonine-protein kinase [Gaiellaceae bacterium]